MDLPLSDEEVQNMPSQNVPLRPKNYLALKATQKKQTQEELFPYLLENRTESSYEDALSSPNVHTRKKVTALLKETR